MLKNEVREVFRKKPGIQKTPNTGDSKTSAGNVKYQSQCKPEPASPQVPTVFSLIRRKTPRKRHEGLPALQPRTFFSWTPSRSLRHHSFVIKFCQRSPLSIEYVWGSCDHSDGLPIYKMKMIVVLPPRRTERFERIRKKVSKSTKRSYNPLPVSGLR